MDPAFFFSTSAQAKSFLDFPVSVRKKIYRYAIFDYDRGAVFLPRAVARKVTAETDEDVEERFENDGEVNDSEGAVRHFAWPENVGECRAAGGWVTGEEAEEDEAEPGEDFKDDNDADADEFDPTSDEDDDSGAEAQADAGSAEDAEMVNAEQAPNVAVEERYKAQDYRAEPALEEVSMQKLCREIYYDCDCPCHPEEDRVSSDGASMTDSDGEESEDGTAAEHRATDSKQDTAASPQDDSGPDSRRDCPNSSKDALCDCLCHPEHPYHTEVASSEEEKTEDEESIHTLPTECRNGDCNSDSDRCENCNPDEPPSEAEDFIELRDLDEQVGMLYHRREPPILLACKQIREECIPVYYGTNSFSWRFLMLDYARSEHRYITWTDQLRNEDAMLIKHLTFEGRHAQEYGVEFVVDIDLLDERPFFQCEVYLSHEPDVPLDAIERVLKGALEEKLSRLSGRGRRQIKFTPDSLAKLGEIFVQYMECDPTDL